MTDATQTKKGTTPQTAGITPLHISDEPPLQAVYGGRDLVKALRRRHGESMRAAWRAGRRAASRMEHDKRFAELSLYDSRQQGGRPYYAFLVTEHLLEQISEQTKKAGRQLSQNELLTLALEDDTHAVRSDFVADAVNAVNASYYASEVAFAPKASLATMFIENQPLNYALGSLLATGYSGGKSLRIKELASGGLTDHWYYESQGALRGGAERVEITLSDFVLPPARVMARSRAVSVTAEQYSLFDDLPKLPADDRYDAMITTYGFDSVWQPEDMHLMRSDDNWYQILYRVKVAEWNPRQIELIEAIRAGQPLSDASAADYGGIFVEMATQPVNIDDHPFGALLRNLIPDGHPCDVPGGLVKRIVNAFESQLMEHGIFVGADVGVFGFTDEVFEGAVRVSGVAAHYRTDNYLVAKALLESVYGFEVELLSLRELAARYLPTGWQKHAHKVDARQILDDTCTGVMVVRRGSYGPTKQQLEVSV